MVMVHLIDVMCEAQNQLQVSDQQKQLIKAKKRVGSHPRRIFFFYSSIHKHSNIGDGDNSSGNVSNGPRVHVNKSDSYVNNTLLQFPNHHLRAWIGTWASNNATKGAIGNFILVFHFVLHNQVIFILICY